MSIHVDEPVLLTDVWSPQKSAVASKAYEWAVSDCAQGGLNAIDACGDNIDDRCIKYLDTP